MKNPEEKEKLKSALLEKLKSMKMKSEIVPPPVNQAQNYSLPVPNPVSQDEVNKKRTLFKKGGKPEEYLYPEIHQDQDQKTPNSLLPPREMIKGDENNGKQEKQRQDQDENQKEAKARQEVRRINRTKRPYYQHYSKEGVYEPCLPHVKEHQNPSGKPPDIPQQLLKGIQIVPKRPWVYFGPQNIPPTDCQEINSHNFSKVYEDAKRQKRHNSGILKKSNMRRKKGRKNEDEISQISDDFTSNFNISDSVDLSKDSDLISEFRSQHKKGGSQSSKKEEEEDDDEDDYGYSMSGSVTQKQKYNLFDSDEQSDQSEQSRRPKSKSGFQDSSFASDKPSSFDSSMSEKVEQSEKVSVSEEQSLPRKRRKGKNSKKKNNFESESNVKESDSISISAPKRSTRRTKKILESQSQLSVSKPATRRSQRQKKMMESSVSKMEEDDDEDDPEVSPSEISQSLPSRRSLRKRKR